MDLMVSDGVVNGTGVLFYGLPRRLASDFTLIFTRSYRCALLVTTLTMNPSLVKHVLGVFQTAHDIKHGSKSRFLESKTIDNNKV